MFGSIFAFEVKRWLRSPSTYIYFVLLLLIGYLMAISVGGAFDGVTLNMAGEKIYVNAPIVIDALFTAVNSYIGMVIVVAIVGNAVLRDFRENTYSLIFTTPVSKFNYLFGRFSASLFVVLVILSATGFGIMLGFSMPFLTMSRLGPFIASAYWQSYWQTIVPNAIWAGAIFFAVSLLARDIFVIWLSLIIFFVAIGVSNSYLSTLEHQNMVALLDPLGAQAKHAISKYWSTYQKNTQTYSMSGLFLLNRLIWLGVALVITAVSSAYFSFTSSPRRLFISKKNKISDKGAANTPIFVKIDFSGNAIPKADRSFTIGTNFRNLWGLAVNECRTLLRNTYFRIIVLFGMLLLFAVSFQIGKIYDTTTYPVTYMVIEFLGGTFQLFMVVLTIMFAGDIVWKAREVSMSNILDALPVPNWVFYISKLIGLVFMQVVLLCILILCGLILQTFKGYTHYELLLYIQYVFGIKLIDLVLLSIVAMLVQVLVSNKYVGYFIVALFYIWNSSFAYLVLKQNVFLYGADPGVEYSDMNGFGHAIYPFVMYKLYWGVFAVALAILSSMLWARGTDTKLKLRFRNAKQHGNARVSWSVITICLLVFVCCGSFIYYNTNVKNKFYTDWQQEELQARYEKEFKKYERAPQPKITAVKLNVDIFPKERNVYATGTYMLKNKTNSAIDSVHIIMPNNIDIKTLSFSTPAQLVLNKPEFTYRIYKLNKPMQPGDSIVLSFDVAQVSKGFENSFTGLSSPLYNGTFMNNDELLPTIGYTASMELLDNTVRKKHGLGYRPTANAMNDSAARQDNLFVKDADFIDFDATVSTSADQTAIAPGYLQKKWTQDGRSYYHYKMDSKIINFYSFLSARYEVKKEMWHNVSLEIYYNKGHEYNLDRMFNGMKKALDYYTTNFSPYQHRQVRILEFPRYATFAQSFPNTIPFSEGIGFIADVDDSSKEDVDYPFYVTAHEVAHQWFAHQVIGADVQGSNMLSETLAQYGAIMVMEKEYGEEKIRKFLHYEMDKYLRARSNEAEKENPLAYVDIGQGYILYQKGGIEMRALSKYIGEDSLNHALSRFIARYAFQGPPYPTTLDLLACIRQSTPDSMQYFVTDIFQRIVLYNNKITEARSTKTADGKYKVDFTVSAEKILSDSAGREKPIAFNDYIEVGVYDDKRNMLQLNRYKLHGITKLSIIVDKQPEKVVVDPRELLIDKNLDDNEMKLGKDGAGIAGK